MVVTKNTLPSIRELLRISIFNAKPDVNKDIGLPDLFTYASVTNSRLHQLQARV